MIHLYGDILVSHFNFVFFILSSIHFHFLLNLGMIYECGYWRLRTWLLDILFFIYACSFYFLHSIHLDCLGSCLIFGLIYHTMVFKVLFCLILISFRCFTPSWSPLTKSWYKAILIWNSYFSFYFSFVYFIFSLFWLFLKGLWIILKQNLRVIKCLFIY